LVPVVSIRQNGQNEIAQKLRKMNGFFAKIDTFFAKIGENCVPFDTFLVLLSAFTRVSDWYSVQPRYAIAMRRRAKPDRQKTPDAKKTGDRSQESEAK